MKTFTNKSNANRAVKALIGKFGDETAFRDMFDVEVVQDGERFRPVFFAATDEAVACSIHVAQSGFYVTNDWDKFQAEAGSAEDTIASVIEKAAEMDVAAIAEATAPAADPKPKKVSGREQKRLDVLARAEAGEILPPPAFAPSAQKSNVRRAEEMYENAKVGNLGLIIDMKIDGKAHSAEMVRRYRDLLIKALEAK